MNSAPETTVSRTDPATDDSASTDHVTAAAPSFASKSLPAHLTRGAVGLGAIGASVALAPVICWVSLLLLPVGLVALRGCPMCWVIGLVQTISRERLKRQCVDGRCRLTSTTSPP